MNKGQISVSIAIIGAVGTIGAAGITGWFSAASAIRKELSTINTKVQVVEEREDNHYRELRDDVGEIKTDVKTILKALGKYGN